MSATLVVVIGALVVAIIAVVARSGRNTTVPVAVVEWDPMAGFRRMDRAHDLSAAREAAEWQARQARHQAWLDDSSMCRDSCCS